MFRIDFLAFVRRLFCSRTYVWFDPRDREWTVTHKGVDMSDLAALAHELDDVRHLGDLAYRLNSGLI